MADDLDEFMKGLGVPSGKPAKKGAEPAAPENDSKSGVMEVIRSLAGTSDIPSGRSPTYEDLPWQAAAGQGVAKGLATLGTEIPQFGNNVIRYFSPSTAQTLGDLANSIPGVKGIQEFADSPYQGPAERLGSYTTQALGMMVGPPVGKLGQLAKQGVNWAFPPVFRGAGKGALRTGWTFNPALGRSGTRSAMKWAGRTGNTAEAAGRGALAGAIANPDDPQTGAVTGAVGGAGAPIAGAALRSQLGKFLGTMSLPEIASYIATHKLGVPYYPVAGPLLIWHQSPVSRQLRRVGNKIFDSAGRLVASVRSEVAGYSASSAAQSLEPRSPGGDTSTRGETDDDKDR